MEIKQFHNRMSLYKGRYIIDTKYDKEIGLLLEADEGYSIDSREL